MERTVDVATGESVALTYELAGLGSRFFAVAIDLTIQIGVVIVAFVALALVAQGHHVTPRDPRGAGAVTKLAVAVLEGIGVVAGFLLFFGYFIAFEWAWNGRTPGKRLLGIRVVRDGGFPLDFTGSVVRNVVRLVEVGLGFYAVSAAVALASPRNRRLGDMAAGTIVVRDARYERAAPAPPAYPSAVAAVPRAADPLAGDLSGAQRDLIRRYVARRASLAEPARGAVAAEIAAVVRPRLGTAFPYVGDDDLLVHLARTTVAGDD